MKYFLLILYVLVFMCHSCTFYEEGGNDPDINVLVLTDLSSNRINLTQIDRDTFIYRTIAQAFDSKVWELESIRSAMAFRIANLNSPDFLETPHEENLSLDFRTFSDEDEAAFGKRNKLLKKFEKEHSTHINNLLLDYSKNKELESDLVSFFSQDLEDLLDTDTSTLNYIIIISDGYLASNEYTNELASFRKDGWETILEDKKLIKTLNKEFNEQKNTKVLFLELNPRNEFRFEYDLLKKTWEIFLNDLGFDEVVFLKNDDDKKRVAVRIGELLGSSIEPGASTDLNKLFYSCGYYEGESKSELPHGKGTFYYDNGFFNDKNLKVVVSGNWNDGIKQGKFQAQDSNGIKYFCECQNDICNFISKDGKSTLYLDKMDLCSKK